MGRRNNGCEHSQWGMCLSGDDINMCDIPGSRWPSRIVDQRNRASRRRWYLCGIFAFFFGGGGSWNNDASNVFRVCSLWQNPWKSIVAITFGMLVLFSYVHPCIRQMHKPVHVEWFSFMFTQHKARKSFKAEGYWEI